MKFSTTTRLLAITIGSFLAVAGTLHASDCNGNGIDDASDLLPQNFGFLAVPSYPVERLSPDSIIAADLAFRPGYAGMRSSRSPRRTGGRSSPSPRRSAGRGIPLNLLFSGGPGPAAAAHGRGRGPDGGYARLPGY